MVNATLTTLLLMVAVKVRGVEPFCPTSKPTDDELVPALGIGIIPFPPPEIVQGQPLSVVIKVRRLEELAPCALAVPEVGLIASVQLV